MKNFLLILAVFIPWLPLMAQANQPIKLALISETSVVLPVADMLTAKLSGNGQVQLLERDQVGKIYREQSLSSAGADYLKLGRILGADGLLVLNVLQTPQATNLTLRLIAVKPGVILVDYGFTWPVKDVSPWSDALAGRLDNFLSKLQVSVGEAIPISVVNLRSAINSRDEVETERELKVLTIQRLSQERQFFVLERQKLQLLGQEKELSGDDSAFWDGRYLLDGVIDQNGYSPDILTLSAQLTPPQGGAVIPIEVSGSRTNLAEIINQLVTKINTALKITSRVPAWNAADEATKYFAEAKWALRWGAYAEAQAAAESAWALGLHDEASAEVRINSYAKNVGAKIVGRSGVNPSLTDGPDQPSHNYIIKLFPREAKNYPGIFYAFSIEDPYTPITSLIYYNSPTPESLDHAIHALQLYEEYQFPDRPNEVEANAAWSDFGLENLLMASAILQHFYLVPSARIGMADKLAELRTLARSVAERISRLPSMAGRYEECETIWGCFWQETPENCVSLYRKFLSDPALTSSTFAGFQKRLCLRDLDQPRLTAWHDDDRTRLPMVWNDFVRELNDSTNRFFSAEGKVLAGLAPSELNGTEVVAKLPDYWRKSDSTNFANQSVRPEATNWQQPEKVLAEMEQARQQEQKQQIRQKVLAQKREYLQTQTRFDFKSFDKTLLDDRYNADEARELLPLVTNFEVRILNGPSTNMDLAKMPADLRQAKAWIGILEKELNRIVFPLVHPPGWPHGQKSKSEITVTNGQSAATGQLSPASAKMAVTNELYVDKYYAIPQKPLMIDGYVPLPEMGAHGQQAICCEVIQNHFERAGKLMLDLRYAGDMTAPSGEYCPMVQLGAMMIFDPTNESWETIQYPRDLMLHQHLTDSLYAMGSLAAGKEDLYLVEEAQSIVEGNQVGHQGQIQKYNGKTGRWQPLKINFQTIPELTVVNDRLFAVDKESIYEITGEGEQTRLLASTRRQPPVTALDSLGSLGSATLFSGLDHSNSLCACVGSKIYSWNGEDWQAQFDFGFNPRLDMSPGAIIFRQTHSLLPYRSIDESLWVLPGNQAAPELYLCQPTLRHYIQPGMQAGTSKPLWQLPPANELLKYGATFFRSNVYFLAGHTMAANASGYSLPLADGCQAELVCLTRDCPEPIIIPLKFDLTRGQLPQTDPVLATPDAKPAWLAFVGDTLYLGQNLTPGIWAIPFGEIEPLVATQKQIILNRVAQAKLVEEQSQKVLLAKYHLDRDGTIDLAERENALDDPAFVAAQLDLIDTNHNGLLDLAELDYFNANQNRKLDAKERAGLRTAIHLLAIRNVQKFDVYQDGVLDLQELQYFQESLGLTTSGLNLNLFEFDTNHDGKIDATEMESCLLCLLHQKLRPGSAWPMRYQKSAEQLAKAWEEVEDGLEGRWRKEHPLSRTSFTVPGGMPTATNFSKP